MSRLYALYNKLAFRERLGVIAILVFLVYILLDVTLIGPEQKRRKMLGEEVARVDSELNALRAEMVGVKAQLDRDPHAKDRAQLDAYKKAIDDADAFLAKVESDPKQVTTLLRQIIAASPGVSLVALKTLPAIPIVDSKAGPAGSPEGSRALYRRAIQVTVRGNYIALLPYLERLQNQPTRVLWSEADLKVGVYPDSSLTVTIYTLSHQREASLG
jgi:MSHA biogenesis protein MshJ